MILDRVSTQILRKTLRSLIYPSSAAWSWLSSFWETLTFACTVGYNDVEMLAYETYTPSFDPSMSYGYKCHSYGHFGHSRSSSFSHPIYRAPHNILILGATGTIGTYITRAIVDANSQGHFGKISIYTSEKTIVEKVQDICALESWGVEIFVGSLDDERRFKDACRGENIASFQICISLLILLQELTQ